MPPIKILIVEDEAIIAMSIENILNARGYEVIGIANTGPKAIAIVQESPPDIILMDIILPGDMDGISAYKKIKEEFDIPIIYQTAHSDQSTLERAKETEPHGYILKPINEKELLSTIEISLYKFGMEKKLQKQKNELEKSARQWQTTFDSISDLISIVSPDHELLNVNRATCEFFGLEKNKIIGKKCYEFFHNSKEPIPNCPCMQALKTRGFSQGEVFENGKYLSISAWPIIENNNQINSFTHIVKDVTEQKLEKDKMIKSESMLRNAEKMARLGNWEWDLTTDTLTWSDQLYHIMGYDSEEAPPSNEIQLKNNYHPDDVVFVAEQMEKVLKDGEQARFDTRIFTRNKKTKHIHYHVKPKFDFTGNITGLFGTMQDITEQKIIEKKLQRSQQTLQSFLNAITEIALLINPEGIVLASNDQTLQAMGLSRNQLIGKNIYDLVPPEIVESRKKKVAEVMRTKKPLRYKDSPFGKTFSSSLYPIVETNGSVSSIAIFAFDITDRK